jgi:hypothetical protein
MNIWTFNEQRREQERGKRTIIEIRILKLTSNEKHKQNTLVKKVILLAREGVNV